MVEAQYLLRDHAMAMFLPLEVVGRIETLVDAFLLQYQKLAFASERNGELLWNNPSKFH